MLKKFNTLIVRLIDHKAIFSIKILCTWSLIPGRTQSKRKIEKPQRWHEVFAAVFMNQLQYLLASYPCSDTLLRGAPTANRYLQWRREGVHLSAREGFNFSKMEKFGLLLNLSLIPSKVLCMVSFQNLLYQSTFCSPPKKIESMLLHLSHEKVFVMKMGQV